MQISLMVEGQTGLTWDRWKTIVSNVRSWGFAGLYRSDHFVMPALPDGPSLEMVVSLVLAAQSPEGFDFGPLVAPLSFRDPIMLARQAAALDDLSGGRMVLGLGAGWMQREHAMFGYSLGDLPSRFERFAEGLHVVWLLLRAKLPVTFHGKFFNLTDAFISPRPGTTRILVGGNGAKRTLPLAARYADVWNGVQLTPARFAQVSAALDRCIEAEHRSCASIKRTTSSFLYFGRDRPALERQLAVLRQFDSSLANLPTDELCAYLEREQGAVVGMAEDVIPRIREFSSAGVQELVLQILDSGDLDGLDAFAESVMPEFRD